jgi:hypothetical protein
MEQKLKTINNFNNNHAPMNMKHLKILLITRTQYVPKLFHHNKHNSLLAAVIVHITFSALKCVILEQTEMKTETIHKS